MLQREKGKEISTLSVVKGKLNGFLVTLKAVTLNILTILFK